MLRAVPQERGLPEHGIPSRRVMLGRFFEIQVVSHKLLALCPLLRRQDAQSHEVGACVDDEVWRKARVHHVCNVADFAS